MLRTGLAAHVAYAGQFLPWVQAVAAALAVFPRTRRTDTGTPYMHEMLDILHGWDWSSMAGQLPPFQPSTLWYWLSQDWLPPGDRLLYTVGHPLRIDGTKTAVIVYVKKIP